MYRRRFTGAAAAAILGVSVALPAGPALAIFATPTFGVGFGTNTTNAPFTLSESATNPLSRSADVVTNSVFGPPA